MFTFQVVGVINGLTPSRDGRVLYLKVIGDPQQGVDLANDESPSALDIACPKDLFPAGATFATRVQIEGSGAIGGREWQDPSKPQARSKTIFNTRLQARSIKLAK